MVPLPAFDPPGPRPAPATNDSDDPWHGCGNVGLRRRADYGPALPVPGPFTAPRRLPWSPAPFELSGHVVDTVGRPVANADVLACAGDPAPCYYAAARLELDTRTPAEELVEVLTHKIMRDASAHTTTDANGYWRVMLSPANVGNTYAAVVKDGYVAKGTPEFDRIEVAPAGMLTVTFDCSGNPCAGLTHLDKHSSATFDVSSPFTLRRQPAGPQEVRLTYRPFQPREEGGVATATVTPGANAPVHVHLKRSGHDERLSVDVVLGAHVVSAELHTFCSGVVRHFGPLPSGPATLEDVGPGPCEIFTGSIVDRPNEWEGGMHYDYGGIKAMPFGPRARLLANARELRRHMIDRD